jgi:hypothetical protein
LMLRSRPAGNSSVMVFICLPGPNSPLGPASVRATLRVDQARSARRSAFRIQQMRTAVSIANSFRTSDGN